MSIEWTTSEHGFDVGNHRGAKMIVQGRFCVVYHGDKITAYGRGYDHEDARRVAVEAAEKTAQVGFDQVMEGK